MMARLFLLPFLLALGWAMYLAYYRIPLYQGRQVFYWIIGGTALLVGFFSMMM
jgi:hypothetical protein